MITIYTKDDFIFTTPESFFYYKESGVEFKNMGKTIFIPFNNIRKVVQE